MKNLMKYIACTLALPLGFAALPADNEVNTKDARFLRDWFRSKRAVSIKEKGGDLFISGDIRAEYKRLSADRKFGAQPEELFNDSDNSTANNQFNNEVNLYFDYRSTYSWAAMRIKFDNFMGALSGTTSDLAVDKAYFGYRLFEDGTTVFDVNVGRNKLYNWFDSKVQYNTLFDGVLFNFATVFDGGFDLDAKVGGTVVDFVTNHYGVIAEATLSDIMNTGLYLTYSYTHWNKNGETRVFGPTGAPTGFRQSHNIQSKFAISQAILGYRLDPEVLHFPVRFYAGFLYNHMAKRLNLFQGRRAKAYYAGLTAGRVIRRGDWAFEMTYQSVGAQAVPEWDMSGIGLGNPANDSVYATQLPGYGGEERKPVGNVNYSGWDFQLIYAITNNISILGIYDTAREKREGFTVPQNFQLFEVEVIYAF